MSTSMMMARCYSLVDDLVKSNEWKKLDKLLADGVCIYDSMIFSGVYQRMALHHMYQSQKGCKGKKKNQPP